MLSPSAGRQEYQGRHIQYVHMQELKSSDQHTLHASPSLLSLIVLPCRNYCICLARCCLIYDIALYCSILLMYYSSPLPLIISTLHVFRYQPSFILCWWHSLSPLTPAYVFDTLQTVWCFLLHKCLWSGIGPSCFNYLVILLHTLVPHVLHSRCYLETALD